MEALALHSLPWYLPLAISIPQAILIIYIGFSLCNINVELNKCIMCSIFIATVSYFIRSLPIPLAANTLILTVILMMTTGLILGIHFRKTLIAVLLGVMISGVIESVVIQVFLQITNHIAEELLVDAGLNLMVYIPVFIVTLATCRGDGVADNSILSKSNCSNITSSVAIGAIW